MNTCAPHGMHLGSRDGRVRVCTRTACAAISLSRAWSQVKAMKPKKPKDTKASTMAQQKAKERAAAASASPPKQWKMKKFENVAGRVYQ